MTKPERHKALCNILNEIYKQKNQAYGDSFHDTFVEEGLAMARIRLTDKLNRFKSLTRTNEKQKVTDESLEDTLLDLANYALMTILEIREANGADRTEPEMIRRQQKPVDMSVLFTAMNNIRTGHDIPMESAYPNNDNAERT